MRFIVLVMLALAASCFIIGCVSIAIPYWGFFRNRHMLETGHFGPWMICKDITVDKKICGKAAVMFKPTFVVLAAGIVGAVGVGVMGLFGLLCLFYFSLSYHKKKDWVMNRSVFPLHILLLVTAFAGALFSVVSLALFSVEQEEELKRGYVIIKGTCFFLQIVVSFFATTLFLITTAEHILVKKEKEAFILSLEKYSEGNFDGNGNYEQGEGGNGKGYYDKYGKGDWKGGHTITGENGDRNGFQKDSWGGQGAGRDGDQFRRPGYSYNDRRYGQGSGRNDDEFRDNRRREDAGLEKSGERFFHAGKCTCGKATSSMTDLQINALTDPNCPLIPFQHNHECKGHLSRRLSQGSLTSLSSKWKRGNSRDSIRRGLSTGNLQFLDDDSKSACNCKRVVTTSMKDLEIDAWTDPNCPLLPYQHNHECKRYRRYSQGSQTSLFGLSITPMLSRKSSGSRRKLSGPDKW